MTNIIRQVPALTVDDVGMQLNAAFAATRWSILDGESVILCVDGPALLGQAGACDSAVATGMLGLARAVAFEGASKGWQINVVALNPGAEPDANLVELASTTPGLSGQVLNVSRGAIGRVIP